MELHRLGGMYVANDFQRLMMRKEVGNWCGETGKKAKGRRNLEPGEHEAVLNVLTEVEVIN